MIRVSCQFAELHWGVLLDARADTLWTVSVHVSSIPAARIPPTMSRVPTKARIAIAFSYLCLKDLNPWEFSWPGTITKDSPEKMLSNATFES